MNPSPVPASSKTPDEVEILDELKRAAAGVGQAEKHYDEVLIEADRLCRQIDIAEVLGTAQGNVSRRLKSARARQARRNAEA